MSEYYASLKERKRSVEKAMAHLDDANSDPYIDPHYESNLESCIRDIDEVYDRTVDELAVIEDPDWEFVETHSEHIIEQLEGIISLLEDSGVANWDNEARRVIVQVDNAPEEIRDLCQYLSTAMAEWEAVRRDANEAKETANGGI